MLYANIHHKCEVARLIIGVDKNRRTISTKVPLICMQINKRFPLYCIETLDLQKSLYYVSRAALIQACMYFYLARIIY